jgi:hypothetical protein
MGKAKRRQKGDLNCGENSDTNIFGRIVQLPKADQLCVIEQMITLAEEQKAKEKLAKKLARKPRTPTDKANEPTAEPHWETDRTAENQRVHHPDKYTPSSQ